MNQTERLGLFASLLDTFLERARERGYIILEVLGRPDEIVQFQLHSGRIRGEVGSRQWNEPERPLPAGAVAGLNSLGFTGGGPERNFTRDGLPAVAVELAQLADRLLRTAYELSDDYDPVVREMNLRDVTMPQARPFTRDMVEAHLRAHDVHFLRDEDGDFRVDFTSDERPGTITVWLIAHGPEDTMYTISGSASGAPQPSTRAETVARCNTWNQEHIWPKAFVVDHGREWRIGVSADLPLGPGIHRELFDEFTRRVIGGILEFWGWLATTEVTEPPRRAGRRPRRPSTDSP